MKLKYILSAIVLTSAIASCSNDVEEISSEQSSPLEIMASIEGTRAAGIDDRVFFESDSIGITVSGTFTDPQYNVKGVFDGSRWNLSTDISVPYGEYTIEAYYPYDKSNEYNMYVTAGTNHLFARTSFLSKGKEPAVVNLTFKHVMSRVRFEVSGAANNHLDSIVVSGSNIYQTSRFQIEGDEVDDIYYFSEFERGSVIVKNPSSSAEDIQVLDALLIPADPSTANLTLYFADGKKYTTTVSLPKLNVGGYYRLPINLNGKSEENPTHEGHEYVDLGLPSGTLWATCNIGAEKAEDYGVSFAWGETKPKTNFYISTYKWCKGTHESMTKYCIDSSYGTVDKKTVLDAEDDAAHVNWGGKWRIPTESEAKELLANCSWVWTTMNDINGYKITGASGKWIFIPAAGWWPGAEKEKEGVQGIYWLNSLSTSSTMPSYLAQYLTITSTSHFIADNGRNCGLSVRPVFNK